jgi:uncharacterized membrane protein YhaH (DUF805 family)
MEFTNAIKYGFKNYANFKGVIDRRTFWWWYLFAIGTLMLLTLISMAVSFATIATDAYTFDGTMVEATSGIASVFSSLANLVSLGLALPTLALEVRRLRDVGTNPLVLLFGLIPGLVLFIGAIIGAAIGAASGSGGYDALAFAAAGAVIGMLPGFALVLGFGIWLIVLLAKPTKTAAQGNKYAVA